MATPTETRTFAQRIFAPVRLVRLFGVLVPGIAILAVWEFGARFLFDPQFVGQPSAIILSFLRHLITAEIWVNVWVTFQEIAIGYTLGILVGVALGYALGVRETLARIFEPYILTLNAIPSVILGACLPQKPPASTARPNPYKKRSLDVGVIVIRGGPGSIAAVLAGDAQFTSVANDEFLKVGGGGRIMRHLTFVNSMTMNLQVRNQVLAERKVSLDLPVKERIRRLKGITLGVIGPGGAVELFGRWLFRYAGLDPKNDVKTLQIGGLPPLVAALKIGKIDAFMMSAPAGQIVEGTGIGKIAIVHKEVPPFIGQLYVGLESRGDYYRANRDVVRRVVIAVEEGQKAIYADPKAAAAILFKGSFARGRQKTLESALMMMRDSFKPQKMTAERWEAGKRMMADIGKPRLAKVELKEGLDWSNEFFVK